MPLRPIDAIFIQQKDRHYVIYQQGALYKLSRLKLDYSSWQRRTPYTGSLDELRLSTSQELDDPKLAPLLHTVNLPSSLHGRGVKVFEDWWEVNGYEWTARKTNTPSSTAAIQEASNNSRQNIAASPSTPTRTSRDSAKPVAQIKSGANLPTTNASATTVSTKPAPVAKPSVITANSNSNSKPNNNSSGNPNSSPNKNSSGSHDSTAKVTPKTDSNNSDNSPTTSPKTTPSDNIFDSMLDELTNEL